MKRQLSLIILCTAFLSSYSRASTDEQALDTEQKSYVSDTEAVTDEPYSVTVYESAQYTLCDRDGGYTLYDGIKNPVGTFDEYHTVEAFGLYGNVEELHYLVKENGDGTYALLRLDDSGLLTINETYESIHFWGDFIVTDGILQTPRLRKLFTFVSQSGKPHEEYPRHNEGITFDDVKVTYYDSRDGYPVPLPDDTTEYLAVTDTFNGEYTCLYVDGDTLICRIFRPDMGNLYPYGDYMMQYEYPAEYRRDFGNYAYYESNGVSWILRDGELICSGYGDFTEVEGLPVFLQSYHFGFSTLFDKDFNILIDNVNRFSAMTDGSILAHRRTVTFTLDEDGMEKYIEGANELFCVAPDGTVTALGIYDQIHALIPEGSFALVSTMASVEATSSVPVHTLMLVDTSGKILQTLGTLATSFVYTDFNGDTQNGEWIFNFFNRSGEHITYEYNKSNN